MRALTKIVIFPLVIVLTLAGLLLRVIIKLESVVAGVAVLLLAICTILALVNKMWLQLGIFGIIFAAMMLCLLASAELQVWIDVATERLRNV